MIVHLQSMHTDIKIILLSCVSLIVEVNLVAVPNMYPLLINKIDRVVVPNLLLWYSY